MNYQYKENDLFKYAEPFHLNACVGKNGGPYDFHAYSLGYFNAAKVLVQTAIAGQLNMDLAVYPIIYNYRHGIELGLKHLLQVLPSIWKENPPNIRATHKLVDVWNEVQPYLRRDKSFDSDGSVIPLVDKVLADIIQFDPDAEVFRFPTERSGNFYLQDSSHINILVLGESLEAISGIFETWFTIASELKHGV